MRRYLEVRSGSTVDFFRATTQWVEPQQAPLPRALRNQVWYASSSMGTGPATAVTIAVLLAPLPWVLLRSCDHGIPARHRDVVSCGLRAASPNGGVICIRYPGACKASVTVVRIEGEPEREWQPQFFPANSSIPFDRPVTVKTFLGEQTGEWQVMATRDKPVVELIIPHEDRASPFLLGYRWGEMPEDTGLRAIPPVRSSRPTTPLFEWQRASSHGCPTRIGLVVDANSRVYRNDWPCDGGPERWWNVGEIDRPVFDRMRAEGVEAVKASPTRVSNEEWIGPFDIRVIAYPAPGSEREGVVLAARGETDSTRRPSPAADIIVPWMLRLVQIAPGTDDNAD